MKMFIGKGRYTKKCILDKLFTKTKKTYVEDKIQEFLEIISEVNKKS